MEAFDLELPDFVFLNQEGIFFLFELLYFRQLGIQVCDGDFQQRVFFRLFIDHIVDKQVGCRNGGNARQHGAVHQRFKLLLFAFVHLFPVGEEVDFD